MLFSYRVLQLQERKTTNYKYSNSYTGLLKVTFKRRKEGNVLFNDVRHMVKDHSDSEKGNLLPPHKLLLYD